MLNLVGRRAVQIAPILIFATFVVFGLLQLVPGDPALVMAGDNASPERIAEIHRQYGFDQPFLIQYVAWLWKVLQGDLGQSLLTSQPVLEVILHRLPNTILITLYALLIGSVVGITLGILAATRAGTRADAIISGIASLGVAIPSFWLAMLLVLYLSLRLGWFPTTGAVPFTDDPLGALRYATLPAIALSVNVIAELARQVRSALIEVLNSQYIRTLRAKGLPARSILMKHGIRNVGVTILTLVGLQVNRIFSGAVIIEAVFAIPGIGSLITFSAINKDFPVIQGTMFMLVLIVIFINIVVDMLSTLIDPRVAQS